MEVPIDSGKIKTVKLSHMWHCTFLPRSPILTNLRVKKRKGFGLFYYDEANDNPQTGEKKWNIKEKKKEKKKN